MGQGTVELILTLFAFFTVAFLFIQVALDLGVANYIHYATFMAARAYLPGYATESAQRAAAQNTLDLMLKRNGNDRFAGIASSVGGATIGPSPRVSLKSSSSRQTAWEQGVSYKFKVRMYMLPMVPGAKHGVANTIELESESWLGRDPTEEECLRILQAKGGGIFDNGC